MLAYYADVAELVDALASGVLVYAEYVKVSSPFIRTEN